MAEETAPVAGGERLHALDLVRAAALLLGIVFHAALSFLPGFDLWLAADEARSWPVAWAAFTLHSFRMAAFFLIAGYFGRMMLARRGTRGFVKDRAGRILAPLAVFWAPVLGSYALAVLYASSVGALPTADDPPTRQAFPWTHLWFLYVLLLFYAATLLARALVGAADRRGLLTAGLDRALASLLRMPLVLPVLLALPVLAMFAANPGWVEYWGVPTPDQGFLPNATVLVAYGLAFALGWLVHRLKDGFAPLARFWAVHLAVALALSLAAIVLLPVPSLQPQLAGGARLAFAACYAGMLWFWSLGLVGAALRFIRRENRVVRYLADSSYWLYIVHLPLIVALQAFVAHWPLPAELKLLFIVAVAMALMLASYQLLIRHSFMGQWLNGKRAQGRRAAIRAPAPPLAP